MLTKSFSHIFFFFFIRTLNTSVKLIVLTGLILQFEKFRVNLISRIEEKNNHCKFRNFQTFFILKFDSNLIAIRKHFLSQDIIS